MQVSKKDINNLRESVLDISDTRNLSTYAIFCIIIVFTLNVELDGIGLFFYVVFIGLLSFFTTKRFEQRIEELFKNFQKQD